ncbi:hypothetical protein DA075_22920 [Methylobacterium currus]|uniref:Uncharacterized protein n=1 Tax=Methylobacterium currus TaxID=2051553 RepID=A0A2R4WPG4_9HYPH|nr:hypothetical protein [Methylobacterium currus]AWB23398.1 hypothetical protein DA075_22920 [Methylobacterium currus]UHC16962.1 hypothetical protein LRS73_03310 [Methylobacterium currus]
MTMVAKAADGVGLRHVGMPRGTARPAPVIEDGATVEDISRYRTIGSGAALVAAIGAALLVTGLIRIVL